MALYSPSLSSNMTTGSAPAPAGGNAPYHGFARVVSACTAGLIFAGALVTSTGSGLAVPDWPLSFGMFFPPMVGGVFFEHGHRMIATAVAFLTAILGFWTLRSEQRSAQRWLAIAAMGAVILQACLGGATVLLKLPPAVSASHATLGQTFFCLLAALAMTSSPSWRDAARGPVTGTVRLQRVAAVATTALVWLQLVVGAAMRHRHAGFIFPDFPTSGGQWVPDITSVNVALNFAHRFGALVVFTAVMLTAALTVLSYLASPRAASHRAMLGVALRLAALVLLQAFLGAITVLHGRPVTPTSLHVVNGALVLVTSLVLALWSWRAFGDTAGEAEAGT